METTITLEGEKKAKYLTCLDKALRVLEKGLTHEKSPQEDAVRRFGDLNKWDWNRLPETSTTMQDLAVCIQLVADQYKWFGWHTNKKPEENYGYFERINISTDSGLPWAFDITQLHNLRANTQNQLEQLPGYHILAKQVCALLNEDETEIDKISETAIDLQKQALRRNFFEKLREAKLLGWQVSEHSLPAKATKLLELGAEELWNITYMSYAAGSGMYHIYVIDAWQDTQETLIKEEGMAPEFIASLRFPEENASWYILRRIEELFPLHPVHVTRAIIGPYENKHRKGGDIPQLAIMQELLNEDEEAGLLRFSRKYCYAPNHREDNGRVRQVIDSMDDWSDEIIVSPAKYSSRVASSVLGTGVRVLES